MYRGDRKLICVSRDHRELRIANGQVCDLLLGCENVLELDTGVSSITECTNSHSILHMKRWALQYKNFIPKMFYKIVIALIIANSVLIASYLLTHWIIKLYEGGAIVSLFHK